MKEQILAVQRMQDFIENNKSEEISLSDLARASLFSPWYAYRLFRDYLGLTPTEYIRKYRLTQAAKQLRSGEVKVIDAAYDAGFANVDTFTRAFYREFGLNPSDYMKYPIPLIFFIVFPQMGVSRMGYGHCNIIYGQIRQKSLIFFVYL